MTSEIENDIELISSIAVVPKILEVICRSTGMGFAAVARVTDKEWIALQVLDQIHFGLKPGGSLVLESTICNEIRQHHNPVVIDEVSTDPIFEHHHTPAQYGFQSYISIPIFKKNGTFFGTLCAIDPRPNQLNNPETIGMFELYAELIAVHMQGFEEKQRVEARLIEEKEIALLRDQFIAILGHDLRNPVGAILSGAELLKTFKLDDNGKQITQIIQNSSYRIMGLIENMLDFAQGRLGEGIKLNATLDVSLEESLYQVIRELKLMYPKREIKIVFSINREIYCDAKRIAQLFSNLLANALTYGVADKPVTIEAYNTSTEFVISVCNAGKPISDKVIPYLFQPFSRGTVTIGQKGLGLGLYIANEIALAHSGHIEVTSTEKETCFILKIPASQNIIPV